MTEPRCDKCVHFRELEVYGVDKRFHICDFLLSEPDGCAIAVNEDDKCEMFTEREDEPVNAEEQDQRRMKHSESDGRTAWSEIFKKMLPQGRD